MAYKDIVLSFDSSYSLKNKLVTLLPTFLDNHVIRSTIITPFHMVMTYDYVIHHINFSKLNGNHLNIYEIFVFCSSKNMNAKRDDVDKLITLK